MMIKLTARRYERKREFDKLFFCVKKSFEAVGKKALYLLNYNDELQVFEVHKYHAQSSKYFFRWTLDPEDSDEAEELRWIMNFIELEQLFWQELDKMRDKIWENFYAEAKN